MKKVESSGKTCISSTGDNLQKHEWKEQDVTAFHEDWEMNKELTRGGVKYGVMRDILMDEDISPQLPILSNQNHQGDRNRNVWSKKVSLLTWEGMIHSFICVFSSYILNFEA